MIGTWVISGIVSVFVSIVIKAIKSTSSNKFYHECFNADAWLCYMILLCGGVISLFNITFYLLFTVLKTYGILRKITDSLFTFFHKEG